MFGITVSNMKAKILFMAVISLLSPIALHAAGQKSVVISAYDTMKFSVTKIEASPGQKITVELKNEGTLPKEAMGHNWILLTAGANASAYVSAAIRAKAQNFQPSSLSSEVIASISLLGPKESAKVTFTAPKAPGNYTFLCSFPAHYQAGMSGLLVVK